MRKKRPETEDCRPTENLPSSVVLPIHYFESNPGFKIARFSVSSK